MDQRLDAAFIKGYSLKTHGGQINILFFCQEMSHLRPAENKFFFVPYYWCLHQS